MAALTRWLTAPVPLGRVAAFRTLVYLFVIADLLYFTPWVRAHAHLPGELYQPLFIGRLLPLPTPTPTLVYGVFAALLVSAAVAATGRLPRLAGGAVALLYLQWMIIAMSYGKVDLTGSPCSWRWRCCRPWAGPPQGAHSVGGGGGSGPRSDDRPYFLAAVAKLQYGGLDWFTGATLTWALIRRAPLASRCWTCQVLVAKWNHGLRTGQPAGIHPARTLAVRDGGLLLPVPPGAFATITISFMPHLVA